MMPTLRCSASGLLARSHVRPMPDASCPVTLTGEALVVVPGVQVRALVPTWRWRWSPVAAELARADGATLERLVTGSREHAVRRADEMEAAAQLLDSLGVPARVSRASQDWLRDLSAQS